MPAKRPDFEAAKPGSKIKRKPHRADGGTSTPPPGKAATSLHTSPQEVGTDAGDPSAVVTQAELAELLDLDERILQLLREANARRVGLADRLFGPTMIEPGPLVVFLQPTPTTAADRSGMKYDIQARTNLVGFLDHRDLNPRGIKVVRHEISKGKKGLAGSGMFGDPRKVNDSFGGYM